MSDDWGVYFTHVDDKPASMLLDLDIEAPIPGMSVLVCVTLDFLNPDESGMSRQCEYDTLMAIEDALVPALAHETCMFVGRCTTNGQRDFFFYMDNGRGVEDKAEAAMAAFPEYTWDMDLVVEPDWATYLEFLYPDEQGLDTIWNNRVRRQLAEHGDNMAMPREIDHMLYFPSAEDRDAFRAEIEAENFRIMNVDDNPDQPFNLLVQREDAPDDIDDVTWPLRELAGAHGGTYDGWGCSVVT